MLTYILKYPGFVVWCDDLTTLSLIFALLHKKATESLIFCIFVGHGREWKSYYQFSVRSFTFTNFLKDSEFLELCVKRGVNMGSGQEMQGERLDMQG